jgi:hypothetical protein
LKTDNPLKIERKEDMVRIQETIEEYKSDSDSGPESEEIKFKQRNTFVGFKNSLKIESKSNNITPDLASFRRNTTVLPPSE